MLSASKKSIFSKNNVLQKTLQKELEQDVKTDDGDVMADFSDYLEIVESDV